uniref:Uncharacterized protein n=1 Tax=uncultured bacterium EIL4H10 TaxID=1768203 RepID=A0A0U2XPM8_9BACT|nr:hypothetical protein [uncultured bacterium EIL4H10]
MILPGWRQNWTKTRSGITTTTADKAVKSKIKATASTVPKIMINRMETGCMQRKADERRATEKSLFKSGNDTEANRMVVIAPMPKPIHELALSVKL